MFQGREYLAAVNLYDFRNRAYSPDLGRFLQMDPIGFGGGNHLYRFAGNNPVSGRDPTGQYVMAGQFDDPGASWNGGTLSADLAAPTIDAGMFGDSTLAIIDSGAAVGTISTSDGTYAFSGGNSGFAPSNGGASGALSSAGPTSTNNRVYQEAPEDEPPNSSEANTEGDSETTSGSNSRSIGPETEEEPDLWDAFTGWLSKLFGSSSRWDPTSLPQTGSMPNVETDVTASEAIANLQAAGFQLIRTSMSNGYQVVVYSNGFVNYTIYQGTSTGGPSMSIWSTGGGGITMKYRLGGW